ncbi:MULTISPECIES: hypothetical protein [Spirulina sp. CCY15215]|uniref:hypothetical protein n=1 Tax=Spirulina sp. CCY15215 TaxID=2767591 RepID=UPI00195221DB|nr:hypothetical protein [Spirulina major]
MGIFRSVMGLKTIFFHYKVQTPENFARLFPSQVLASLSVAELMANTYFIAHSL